MTTALLASVLAVNNFGDTRDADAPAGPIALLIILVLVAITIFLVRNMNSRLRRLPDRFAGSPADGPGKESGEGKSEPTARAPEGGNIG